MKPCPCCGQMTDNEQCIATVQRQGERFAAAVDEILGGLGLSAEQWERVPQVVPVVLRAITGGETA
jgi:hypothetical protein